jgi:hypothetical protein
MLGISEYRLTQPAASDPNATTPIYRSGQPQRCLISPFFLEGAHEI